MGFPLLAAQVPFFIDLHSTNSTNSVATDLVPLPAYSAIVSMNQTSGRGRLGRTWLAEPGNSLALSIALPRQQTNQEIVPLLVGLAALRAVRGVGVSHAELKWPNDILVKGQKISGVLCEMLPTGTVIAGIGLNLRFADERPVARATSLAEQVADSDGLADSWASLLLAELRTLVASPAHEAHRAVQANVATINRPIEVDDFGGHRWAGTAEDVDSQGRLIVTRFDGESVLLAAGDVHHLYQ